MGTPWHLSRAVCLSIRRLCCSLSSFIRYLIPREGEFVHVLLGGRLDHSGSCSGSVRARSGFIASSS